MQHDGADKGDGRIDCDKVQLTDARGHGGATLLRVSARVDAESSRGSVRHAQQRHIGIFTPFILYTHSVRNVAAMF
ncbi:hypothetical protein [Tardiphaga sp. 619_E2_N8_5]|uniref:hypothetical protein n=1 Tax=unclassified Tardiphaga TaxID=2631404 RepID=UPI003F1F5CB9